MPTADEAILGSLLGTAVGDALGFAYEGVSRRRAPRLLGEPDRYRLIPGRGVVSDDTEHAIVAAQALAASAGEEDAFGAELGRRLRRWLFTLPPGIGGATLRSLIRHSCGVPAHASGVFSAGNGPAMRSALLGAAVEDLPRLCRLTRAGTRLTHTDPRAEQGALAVALAAREMRRRKGLEPQAYLAALRSLLPSGADEFHTLMQAAAEAAEAGDTLEAYLERSGMARGVSGYVYHTVPAAFYLCLRYQRDLPAALIAAIRCGGDTDTVAAIVGGVLGAGGGADALPAAWRDRLLLWPYSRPRLEALASAVARAVETGAPQRPPDAPFPALLARNALALWWVVLAHALRRLLPPY